jgi:altronate hydrolase
MRDDMDVDAGSVVEGRTSLAGVADEIMTQIAAIAAGDESRSEALDHQEFSLGYKTFDRLGPACHPGG